MGTTAISNLTTAQVGTLVGSDLSSFSTPQIQALTATQLNSLSQANLQSLDVTTLSTSQISALSTASLNNLSTTQIGNLSTAQVHALTTTQLNGLSQTNFNALSLANLTNAQLGGLTTAAANFSTTQINALTSSEIPLLSIAGLNDMSTAQIGTLSSPQVQALTATQLNGLSTANFNALNLADLTTTQFTGLTTALGKLSPSQFAQFSSSQANTLLTTKLSSLSAAAFAGLSAAQASGLTTAQLNALSASQTASLLANEANNLSIAQISTFTASQLSTTTLVGAAGGLQFNLSWDAKVANAPAGYRNAAIAAAAGLSATFSNHVVLNIQIGYGEVNGTAVSSGDAAQSEGIYSSVSYSSLYTALQADSGNSTVQTTADQSLSATNPTSGTFDVSSANAKALGLAGASSSLNGYVSLSSALPFEYNQTATSGKYDAVAMFQHEFTEVMGRTGSVGAAIGPGVSTPLDLFRYTSTDNADPSAGTPVLATTQQGANTDYFSIDGGMTNLGDYNASNGTQGDYADWNSNMSPDPFYGAIAGTTQPMSGNDVAEVAAIGWNMTAYGNTRAQAATTLALV